MKSFRSHIFLFSIILINTISYTLHGQEAAKGNDLKVVIIRHGEKPIKGDNLTCKGLNRSLQLPPVLYSKFGIPDYTYVPALGLDEATKHARMFQTVTPFAAKYNLTIDSKFGGKDSSAIAPDVLSKKGTVLMVWDHKAIPMLARTMGVKKADLKWDDNDYDSIWIITFKDGQANLKQDKEGLRPGDKCPY